MDDSVLRNVTSAITNTTSTLPGGAFGELLGPATIASNHTAMASHSSNNGVALAFAWIVVMLCCCWCLQPTIPSEEHRRGLLLRQRARELYRQRTAAGGKKLSRQQRMECMDKSLITKKIMDCDSEGNLTLGDVPQDEEEVVDLEQQQSPPDEVRSVNSIEADDDASTCVICLAAFRVGDVVSWSKVNSECLHVFHRDCIISWLRSPLHNDCPSCRSIILKIDSEEEGGMTTDESEDDKPDENDPVLDGDPMGDHSDRSNHSTSQIFVIMHGLVSRARRASYSLIGQNIDTSLSFDDEDDLEEVMQIPPPSPGLRRVVSLGDRTTSSDNIDIGSARLRSLSLVRRRGSLRSNREQQQSPQIQKPTRSFDRSLVLPPLASLESLNRPLKLRRVVSADTESAKYRLSNPSINLSSSSLSTDVHALPKEPIASSFMQAMRRKAATLGAYARLSSNGDLDDGERSLEQEDSMISPAVSADCTQRSVSWSSDLVMSSSQPPAPRRRPRSTSSYQQGTFDEDEDDDDDNEYHHGEEDFLSDEDELELVRTHTLSSDRSSHATSQIK